MTKLFILSKNQLFTETLEKFFKDKGCDVVSGEKPSSIDEKTGYLVVVNIDGEFSNSKSLEKKLLERGRALKVVSINSLSGLESPAAPVKQIFVDNVVGLRMEALRALYKKSLGACVYLPFQAWLAVCPLSVFLERVAAELFSFSENKSFLLGKLVSYREIVGLVNPGAQIYVDVNLPHRLPKAGLGVVETSLDIAGLKAYLLKVQDTPKVKPKPKGYTRAAAALTAATLFIISIPYLLLAASGISAALALNVLKAGQLEKARPVLSLAANLSRTSNRLFAFSKILPLADAASVLESGTGLVGRVLAVSDYAAELTTGVASGGEVADPAQELYLELSALYRDLSFFEYKSLPFGDFEIAKYRSYVLTASRLVQQLPDILGYDRPKTYMVLLQNNMELRPTGGFIGSFALLTFSKGELIDNTVYDVYTADGQLKGYITPPGPIEEHLGEASWTLRDANWDPAFPKTAERVEWFLDKSLDREVDGVIGVNLEVAKKYLEVLGPLKLPDFGDTIDSKNLYEKVQFEVEDNFFPGSRKKAHYLSALMNAIISRAKNVSKAEAIKLILATVDNLESRDIQISLHSEEARQAFKQEMWDGDIVQSDCGTNCASMLAGLVEANLGVNKANYYISRQVQLDSQVGNSQVEVTLTLTLKNNAPSRDRIPQQRYKAYIRALAPESAEFEEAYEIVLGKKNYFDVDIEVLGGRSEYGLLVEVLPGETRDVVFRWSAPVELDFAKDGQVSLYWWKQSGVGGYPFTLNTKLPSVARLKSTPPSALTEQGSYIYNTTLVRDLMTTFSWRSQ